MSFITVAEAEKIVLSHAGTYGVEDIPFDKAVGRLLAEDIIADRDLPPYDRVTMDGIAVSYAAFKEGARAFRIKATMSAGDTPVEIDTPGECIELMTGCALPGTVDTVVRYEDLIISGGVATINADSIKPGANIHRKGSDKEKGRVVVSCGSLIDATVISMATSVGQSVLTVKKLPRVVIVSTGDELVDVHQQPGLFQVRRSNSYAIQAVLQGYGIAAEARHIPDDREETIRQLKECVQSFDVIILSGGVSMGKYDFVPASLNELGVTRLFHKVKQRPGKPFWFGVHEAANTHVFAFPGNPVSAFLCLHRYFVPWLQVSLGYKVQPRPVAILSESIIFQPQLEYYLQVNVRIGEDGRLVAVPVEGNGSGDFSNLLQANAFMELPAEITNFNAGGSYRIWPFKQIIG